MGAVLVGGPTAQRIIVVHEHQGHPPSTVCKPLEELSPPIMWDLLHAKQNLNNPLAVVSRVRDREVDTAASEMHQHTSLLSRTTVTKDNAQLQS